jgi:hypothetical protein
VYSNGSPRKTDQITSVFTFLVTQNDATVTCHSIFKMFPVISRGFWQQAVYCPSADIDIVIST